MIKDNKLEKEYVKKKMIWWILFSKQLTQWKIKIEKTQLFNSRNLIASIKLFLKREQSSLKKIPLTIPHKFFPTTLNKVNSIILMDKRDKLFTQKIQKNQKKLIKCLISFYIQGQLKITWILLIKDLWMKTLMKERIWIMLKIKWRQHLKTQIKILSID